MTQKQGKPREIENTNNKKRSVFLDFSRNTDLFDWSECGDLNSGPLGPEPSALPAALHPVKLCYYTPFSPFVKDYFAEPKAKL